MSEFCPVNEPLPRIASADDWCRYKAELDRLMVQADRDHEHRPDPAQDVEAYRAWSDKHFGTLGRMVALAIALDRFVAGKLPVAEEPRA